MKNAEGSVNVTSNGSMALHGFYTTKDINKWHRTHDLYLINCSHFITGGFSHCLGYSFMLRLRQIDVFQMRGIRVYTHVYPWIPCRPWWVPCGYTWVYRGIQGYTPFHIYELCLFGVSVTWKNNHCLCPYQPSLYRAPRRPWGWGLPCDFQSIIQYMATQRSQEGEVCKVLRKVSPHDKLSSQKLNHICKR